MTNPKPIIAVAPMLDWTDRHCRMFHRLISPHAVLYTEMVTCGAILHGDTDRHLRFHQAEHPVALQLGGSEPADMAACTKIAAEYGYDEVNINIGCPSDRVQKGAFGACLMAEKDLVAACVTAMKDAAPDMPVTIKTRIGIDDQDSYDFLCDFISTTHQAGCTHYTIHARKAWLSGLSPKENREIPELKWDVVHRVKKDFPQLTVLLNGGIKTIDDIRENMAPVDGMMIGREAYQNPWFLHDIEQKILGHDDGRTPDDVIDAFTAYAEKELQTGAPLNAIYKCTLGLFQGMPGARAYRRTLSENMHKKDASPLLLKEAASCVKK